MDSCKHRREFERTSLKLPSCSYTPRNMLLMLCPNCREDRQKADWAPSQWKARSAHTYQFNCCKVCSHDCFFVAPDALARYWQELERSMAALKETSVRWIALFECWMMMPRDIRKLFSYYGGIRMRPGDDRMSLIDPTAGYGDHRRERDPSTGALYHDPGNFVYGLAVRMMWPQFLDGGQQYNNGNIWGCIRGYFWALLSA